MKIFNVGQTARLRTTFYKDDGTLFPESCTAAIRIQNEALEEVLSSPMQRVGDEYQFDWQTTEEGRFLLTFSSHDGDFRVQKQEIILVRRKQMPNY